ncbi:hypothetical protein [Caballeronia sp. dw_19]|jgi:hypothetical protein|uniref:hypothetical protein n=1 Tax=unclassified Caballeronia TaxID=2646786 RepID=UPI001BD3E662|nr:hypothetical protein [Caballeronia sp. dw_19]
MSHVSPSPESLSRTSLWVVGIAIFLVCVEASWKTQSTRETSFAAARHVVISNDARAPDYAVYRAADDRTVSFSLKAGDDCTYIDDADSVSQDGNTGSVLVPVFCPARGAGWTSLSLLTHSEPGPAR